MITTDNGAVANLSNLIAGPVAKRTRKSRVSTSPTVEANPVETVASMGTAIVMAKSLKGTLTSHFDAISGSFLESGFEGADLLVTYRVRILSLAHPKLSGIHSVRGMGTIAFAKAIVDGIEALEDKEVSKTLLSLWRKASIFFALFRTDKGQKFGVEWAKL